MSDFRNWLLKQRTREDNIGKMAKWAYNCPTWDGKQQTLKKCLEEKYIQGLKTFEKARAEFRARPHSPTTSAKGPYQLTYRSFNKTFSTKDDIREYYKNLKDSNFNRTLTGDAYEAVMALFKFHPTVVIPDEDDDIEMDIRVAQHAVDANYCFHFNGEEHSYQTAIQCVGHVDESVRMRKCGLKKFFNTARCIVKDQIPEHVDGHHYDHVNFFSHLLYDWFLAVGPDHIKDIQYVGHGSETRFVQEELNDSWYTYHQTNAILKCIPAKDNLARRPPALDWVSLY